MEQKLFADRTLTLFGNEFNYTTERKKINILLERKCLKM